MILRTLTGTPEPDLARALAAFESGFTYPLGPGASFRICHGDDYPRFFRAMGDAVCLVAAADGRVLGCVAATQRPLLLPDGRRIVVVYLADLKVVPEARGTLVLRLLRAVADWAEGRSAAAFAVVMDGTGATPDRYTGRFGLPPFQPLGKVAVLRLPTAGVDPHPAVLVGAPPSEGEATFQRLSRNRFATLVGDAALRSESAPRWLLRGHACGLLEDTRRAKRLLTVGDGAELLSAHLSCFAFSYPAAGARVLRTALACAARDGFPALFTALPPRDADAVLRAAGISEAVVAGATVYGCGLDAGAEWNVNTSEI